MTGAGSAADRRPLIWLSEAQVASLVDINDAMDALRLGFVEEANGEAGTIDKALGTWPDGAMHALGALSPARHYAGFKTWVHTKNGATAIFSLFDMRNGSLLAVLEAATLGQIRTSAVSGLAADVLANPDVDEMALVGTGAQAMTQIATVAAVRPLRRVKIFSPSAESRAAFVKRAESLFDLDVIDCGSLDEAVNDSPIVTLITRASEPFLDAKALAPGTLLIAAGAILPANAEFFPSIFERTSMVVVDSLGNAQKNSRELRERFGPGPAGWGDVADLGTILRDGYRSKDDMDIMLFKPLGTGLSDLSVAIMAYERAIERGVGLGIDQPQRVSPRWRVASAAI